MNKIPFYFFLQYQNWSLHTLRQQTAYPHYPKIKSIIQTGHSQHFVLCTQAIQEPQTLSTSFWFCNWATDSVLESRQTILPTTANRIALFLYSSAPRVGHKLWLLWTYWENFPQTQWAYTAQFFPFLKPIQQAFQKWQLSFNISAD